MEWDCVGIRFGSFSPRQIGWTSSSKWWIGMLRPCQTQRLNLYCTHNMLARSFWTTRESKSGLVKLHQDGWANRVWSKGPLPYPLKGNFTISLLIYKSLECNEFSSPSLPAIAFWGQVEHPELHKLSWGSGWPLCKWICSRLSSRSKMNLQMLISLI